MIEVISLQATAFGPMGEEDPASMVILTDEGILMDSVLCGTVGITWEDLARILDHPFAEEKLQEVDAVRI